MRFASIPTLPAANVTFHGVNLPRLGQPARAGVHHSPYWCSMNVLVMNPGGNSLKVEVVSCAPTQQLASEGKKLASVILEGIGKDPCLSVMQGRETIHTQPMRAKDLGEGAISIFSWLEEEKHIPLRDIACIGVRVVHGGARFSAATRVAADVEREIHDFERLAPLHNKSSLELFS